MNKLLQAQLRKHFGDAGIVPENMRELLNIISGSYDHCEKDSKMTERSIEFRSKEMIELNTGLKKENEALKNAHKELKTLFEGIAVVLYSVDMVSFELLQISAACEKVYGYTSQEFFADGELWQKVIHPEDKHIAEQHLEALSLGKQVLNQYRIIHKDKSIRWLESKIIPTLDKNGQLIRMNGVTNDITERKIAEQQMRESEAKYRSFFENSLDGILLTITDGDILAANPAACAIFQMTEAEICKGGRFGLVDVTDPKLKPLIEERRRAGIAKGEITLIRKDGSKFPGELTSAVFKDAYGQERTSMILRDVSERKIAEDKLITTSNELQHALRDINKIMNSSLDVICAVNEDGYFVQVSAACETVWGYKADELIGKLMIDFVHPEDREKTQKAAVNVIAGNNMINFENRYIRKDGSLVPINWSARWDANDRIRYGVARDATEKKRLEKVFEIERGRFNDLFLQAPSCIGILKGPTHVFEMANPLYLQLIGKDDIIGKSVKDVLPEIAEQGFIELLDGVYKTGKTFSANEMLIKLDKKGNGELADMYLNFIYQAYNNNEGKVEGIFFFAIDVTEQVLSRKKIEESELRYRSLIEQATDAICIADASLKFIDMNPYACRVLGYSKEEALRLSVMDIIFSEDLTTNPFQFNKVKTGEIIRNERRFKRKDGTRVIMEVSTQQMEDGRFIMFGHDVSKRKKSEEALRESEKRLRQIIDLVPHFIFAKDAEGKFVLANEAVARAYGCSVEDLIGKTDADYNSNKEEVEYFMQEDFKVINSGNTKYNTEETMTDASGNVRVLSTTKIPYTSPGLGTPGVLGVSVDISENKKAEAVLKESEGQLSVASQIAKLGYWEFDVAKNLFKFNDQFYSIFKTTAEQVGGYTMSSERYAGLFVHPDDIPMVVNETAKAIKSTDPHYTCQIEHRIKYPDGEIGYMTFRFFIAKNETGRTIKVFGAIQDITDRKKAEFIVKETKDQLTIATQIAKLGYWEFDVVKNVFKFNDQFYSIFKTTAEKVGGYTMSSERYASLFVHPDDIPMVAKEAADSIKSPDSYYNRQIEHRIKYANGGTGHIAARFFIVKNEQGRTIKTFGAIQDITERKKADEALTNNELRFRTLTSNAPVGIFQTDAKGKTIYVNETWLRYTGMVINEALGDGWMAAVHPDDRNGLIENWSDESQKGIKSFSEYRLIDRKGNIRWVSGEAIPLFNIAGEISGHIGTLSDITDRKNSEVEIRRSEERYRQIVETAQEGIWLIDEDNVTIFVNKKMAEILEYSIEEMMGKKNYCFMDEDWKKTASQNIVSRRIGMSENHDFKYITKSGKDVWTNLSTNPVFDDAGMYKGALAMVTDITQRKLHENLLKQSEADLEIKNKQLEYKNKELEQFAYVASHDMQEPLRTTSSFVELLQKQYNGRLDEKADKYLTFIAQSSDRMKVLIKDLLDYSRIGRKKELAEVDCNIMLNEVLADLGKAINEAKAEIKTDDLPLISGYPTEIKQLFQNLVINSIKFRKQNTIPVIHISATEKSSYWEFIFKDNGIGIDEQHRERIFIIFQRLHTRNEYDGSGIGLAHCKKIVELHGGNIWIESIPGDGTTFHFTIRKNMN